MTAIWKHEETRVAIHAVAFVAGGFTSIGGVGDQFRRPARPRTLKCSGVPITFEVLTEDNPIRLAVYLEKCKDQS
jgi:hypothetical protein